MVALSPSEKLATVLVTYVFLTAIKLLSEAFFDIMNSIENITGSDSWEIALCICTTYAVEFIQPNFNPVFA